MRVVFAGTPEVALPSLRAVLASRHEVVAVVTRPDAPAGRGRRLTPSPVAEVAAEQDIEVLKPSTPKDPDFLERLRALAPQCVPVVAYGGLVPPAALQIPEHGWVNLHFSLLPAWRGAAPVQHALLHGDAITGATTFRLVPELDAGPVLALFTERVRDDDTTGTLLTRLSEHGAGLLSSTLDAVEEGIVQARPQPADGVSVAPKLSVQDARVRWAEPARATDRRVRACTPAPGAWTVLRGERVKLGPVRLRPEVASLGPGEVAATKHEVLVGAADHAVSLGEVRAQGRRPMPAADWARGLRLEPGEAMADPAFTGEGATAERQP